MPQWGMVIDLRQCFNCKTCEVVCSQTNEVPKRSRRTVFDFGVNKDTGGVRISLPMSCMQCAEPPCLDVCPTTATYQRSDGIVSIDNDMCIGCGYCIVGCPYNARSIIHSNDHLYKNEAVENSPVDSILGICTKCDFCADKIDKGVKQGARPGYDPEATPSCVNSCTANALHFGDLLDPESKVSRLIAEENIECLHDEAGTEPSLFYILPEGYSFSRNKVN